MAIMSSLTGGDYYDYQVKNGQGYEIELSIKNNKCAVRKTDTNCNGRGRGKRQMTITLHMLHCQRFFA